MSEPLQPQTKASRRDRAYFRALGRFKYESHLDALRSHLARSGKERLVRAISFVVDGPHFDPQHPVADDDHPEELYERARRLGLYRP